MIVASIYKDLREDYKRAIRLRHKYNNDGYSFVYENKKCFYRYDINGIILYLNCKDVDDSLPSQYPFK